MIEMKEIPLTKGKVAIVDDDVYDYLMQWKWYYEGTGYAARRARSYELNPGKLIKMHRAIMNVDDSKIEIDHINGDKLDNRRSNLRKANRAQNTANRGPLITNTSGYKGVSFAKREQLYRAYITFNGKQRGLGYHKTKEEAALAYNQAASFYYGEFAKLNEVKEMVV
jgi:hypothetical protein